MTIDDAIATMEITDVLHRYARAMDRMDADMALSCWHENGTDDHAPLYSGSAEGFITWLWPVHARMEVTRHLISNILIEVSGDRASAESYYTVTLRIPHGADRYDSISQGRYIDRFERLDGRWAIRHRIAVNDWNRTEPVNFVRGDPRLPILIEPHNPEVKPQPTARDHSDISYSLLTKPASRSTGAIQ